MKLATLLRSSRLPVYSVELMGDDSSPGGDLPFRRNSSDLASLASGAVDYMHRIVDDMDSFAIGYFRLIPFAPYIPFNPKPTTSGDYGAVIRVDPHMVKAITDAGSVINTDLTSLAESIATDNAVDNCLVLPGYSRILYSGTNLISLIYASAEFIQKANDLLLSCNVKGGKKVLLDALRTHNLTTAHLPSVEIACCYGSLADDPQSLMQM